MAWDFLESESLHRTIPWQDVEITLRGPTYDTSFTSSISGIGVGSGSGLEPAIGSPIVAVSSIGGQE